MVPEGLGVFLLARFDAGDLLELFRVTALAAWTDFDAAAHWKIAVNGCGEEWLHRLHTQPFNPLEVATIVGEEGKVVSECSGANEEIAIPDQQASSSQPATFFAKDFAGFLIKTEDRQFRVQKTLQRSVTLDRVTGIINSLVEFCEGDDGESKPFRHQFLKASRDVFDVVQVVNDPICIDQVCHSFGSGRVLISRSA